MNKYYKYIIVFTFLLLSTASAYTATVQTVPKATQLNLEAEKINYETTAKTNFIKTKYTAAESRFLHGNINVSRDNFEDIISKIEHDDYVLLSYGIKMAEFGFFEQTENLFSKLDKNLYTENYINDIKKFYYPSNMLDKKDILTLADAYSAIVYNNLAIETTSEIMNNSNVSESDYKNYIISLGFYKSNNLNQALFYINNAIKENDTNISYKLLKTKILADMGRGKQAIKLMNEIQRTKFTTVDFQTRISATKEYLQYKILQDSIAKEYHLANYYYLQGKSQLAGKVLQSLILSAKDELPDIYGLLSRICYENGEISGAQEYSQRAYNLDNKNYNALFVLGNLNYDERNYEYALNLFKKAYKKTKNAEAGVGVAKSYLAINKRSKSAKTYEKLLRKHSNNEDVLIGALNVFPQKADDYLAKSVSVDISNNDIWLTLADLAIKDGNFSMARSYLNNSYYIDENNFKYYYYLSLVYKAMGNNEKANLAFLKSVALNPAYCKDLGEEGIVNGK